MDHGAPQPPNQGSPTTFSTSAAAATAPTNTPALGWLFSRVLLSRLMLVATAASILSTLAFIGYLLLPLLTHHVRSSYAGIYGVGIIGLLVAEAFQILGVLALLARWFARATAQRKPRELIVLLLSLIPYALVVVFLVTLIVYLRARSLDPTSARTREAAQELKEQTVDTFIDAGANTGSNTAGGQTLPGAPGRPVSLRRTQEAVRRVIGPTTSEAISGPVQGLANVTMCALLLSTLATLGVVLPAKGLTPLQSHGGSASSGAPQASAPSSPSVLSGKWAFTMTSTAYTCTSNASGVPCSLDNLSRATFLYSGPATLQHSGSRLSLLLPTTPNTWNLSPAGFGAGQLPSKLSGTLAGQTLTLAASAKGPSNLAFGQEAVTYSIHFTGSTIATGKLRGTYTYSWYWAANAQAGLLAFTAHTAGAWTATRTGP